MVQQYKRSAIYIEDVLLRIPILEPKEHIAKRRRPALPPSQPRLANRRVRRPPGCCAEVSTRGDGSRLISSTTTTESVF